MGVRKGFLFTFDVILASVLLVLAIVLFMNISAFSSDPTYAKQQGDDVLASLSAIPLQDLEQKEPWIQDLYNDTLLTPEDSLLYALGMLWVLEDERLSDLTQTLNNSLPQELDVRVRIEQDEIFYQPAPFTGALTTVSSQQITGIDRGLPIAGSSGSAFLNRVRDKKTGSFISFGGFVGQGNISSELKIPADVTADRVLSLFAEIDVVQSFTLYVNSNYCGVFTPTQPEMIPDVFNLSSCSNLLTPGSNTFLFSFDDLSEAYISGGFISATYQTDTFTNDDNAGVTRYAFPEISGIVNLYDGVIIPANVSDIQARLRYETYEDEVLTYLTFGERTVYSSNASGVVDVMLSQSDFESAGVDISELGESTVPLRFASFNATSQVVALTGDADVVIITDYSGSMSLKVSEDTAGVSGDILNCEETIYNNSDIARSYLARCLNKEVVQSVMEYEGNRIFPVHFHNTNMHSYINPDDEEAIINFYNTYTSTFPETASGGTPLASALSEAYDIFSTYSSPERNKVIVFMSDGLPSHCARSGGACWFFGLFCPVPTCDVINEEVHPTSSCTGSGSGSECVIGGACQDPIDNTLLVAQALHDDFDVTIHSIAFGPIGDCDSAGYLLSQSANITGGDYYSSADPEELQTIYANVSETIINNLTLVSQSILVPENVTLSNLLPGSYIEINHSSLVLPELPNEIEITRQTAHFGSCNPVLSLPSGVRFKEAYINSYSGPHWTDLVEVNDQQVYSLESFFVDYTRLGDPQSIYVPPSLLEAITSFTVRTGDSPVNSTGCSSYNSLIYSAYVPVFTSRTVILPKAQGCVWEIETELEGTRVATIPSSYNGSNTCSYTSSSIVYDTQDAAQVAVFNLLSVLDIDDTGRIFLGLDAEDFEIILNRIDSIPYLWGPIKVSVEVRR